MLNFFRRDARLALPLTETPRPALEDAKEAPNRTRTSFVLPVVAVCIVAIVLVAEKLTGRLASLLGHGRYSRDTLPGGACLIGPRQTRQPLRKAPGGPAPTDTTWLPGSAIIAIVVLKLSCCLQPGGSTIFDGATGTWRLSPIYCLWYMDDSFMVLAAGPSSRPTRSLVSSPPVR